MNTITVILFTVGGTLTTLASISLILVYRVATVITETSCRQMTGVFGFPGLAFLIGGLINIVSSGPLRALLFLLLLMVTMVALFTLLGSVPELKKRQKKPVLATEAKSA